MSGFKLIAIRPLKGCDPKYLKVLREDRIYKFYQDYNFYPTVADTGFREQVSHEPVYSISFVPKLPEDLYTIPRTIKNTEGIEEEDPIHLNISAIVGKNGAGKSSLIELLYISVYLLAVQEKILPKHDQDKEIRTDYGFSNIKKKVEDRISELKNNKANFLSKITKRNLIEGETLEDVIDDFSADKKTLDWKIKELNKINLLSNDLIQIRKDVKVELFYQIKDKIYKIRLNGEKCEIFEFSEKKTFDGIRYWITSDTPINNSEQNSSLSKYFFYSLVLNYSHYALNSKDIGDWISELFHKNDGYQTPIVINPMRDKGIIDINNENYLVHSRLLATLLTPSKKKKSNDLNETKNLPQNLIDNKIAEKIILEIDRNKFKKEDINNLKSELKYESFEKFNEVYWPIIHEKFIDFKGREASYPRTKKEWDIAAKDYIFGKLISMAKKYPPYNEYIKNDELSLHNFENYLTAIKKDTSHITYKFKQAINYLKYNYSDLYFEKLDKGTKNELGYKPAKLVKLANKIDEIRTSISYEEELILFVPPSFFKSDIILSDIEHILITTKDSKIKKNNNTLNNLSSGEKQKIYATSSIIYHLNYLDSVKPQHGIKYKYDYINIIFDEVELYYHPNLQRNFIEDFRNAIKRSNVQNIKNINCVFITHSPFILSDIPNNNIMFLETEEEGDRKYAIQNKQHKIESFGANIHDLLDNSFFMDSTTGEYALNKMEELIRFYYKVRDHDGTKINEIRDEFEKNKIQFEFLKSNMGEDVYREVLSNHYSYIVEFFKENTSENVQD